MKKITKLILGGFILLFSLVFISSNIYTSADTGPKRKIIIEVEGNAKNLYMTLLSEMTISGPFNTDFLYVEYTDLELEISDEFVEYEDKDGYNYLYFIDSLEDNKFEWSYFPPTSFKILLYNAETCEFITNDVIYNTYAFSSYYKLVLNDTSFELYETYDYSQEIISFFIRLVACLIIEIGIALLFRIFRKQLLIVLATNVVTQIILNLALNLYIHFNGFGVLMIIVFYLFLELIIFGLEFLIYYLLLHIYANKYHYPSRSIRTLLIYTLTSNLASFVLGGVILAIFNLM